MEKTDQSDQSEDQSDQDELDIWEDRCKGCLFGCFIGDSMGAAYEFPNNTTLKDENALNNGLLTRYKRFTFYSRMNNNKPIKFKAGTITDDSIFTIDLLTSLSKEETSKDRRRRYYDILHSGGPFADKNCGMFGRNTVALFKTLDYEKNYEKQFNSTPGKMAVECSPESNGFLMRCSPLAFQKDNSKLNKQIKKEVMLTNPTQNCVDICKIYIKMIRMGLRGESIEDAISYGERKSFNNVILEKIFQCVRSNKTFKPSQDQKCRGWGFVAFYYAVYALNKLKTLPFEQIIPKIIKKGGDTDTNAAIAGALIGSFVGFDSMLKNEITYQNINTILIPYDEDEIIKYRRVPQKDWKKICKYLRKLIDL